ncbi:MAG: glycosyltransferase family 9 protein [Syntrophaceae bacterium]|nr:glycosyltransferase family 9 protein [Syntrophaceae bacterium]
MAAHRDCILIVLVAGIGDLILASKGIRAIRNGYPGAAIHLLTSTDAAPLARHYPYIDRVWPFPIRELRGDKAHALAMLGLVRRLRRFRYRMAVNLYSVESVSGALKMGLLFRAIRACQRAGHDRHGFGLFLTKRIAEGTFADRHFAEAILEAAVAAGGVADGAGVDVFWDRAVEARWSGLFPERRAEPVVGLNPGSDRSLKRWDPARYSRVADRLVESEGARIVLLGGPAETRIAEAVEQGMRHPAVNLSGKLRLDDLACVISGLDLLVTNDSGPMHIAAAAGTPLVALFGPSLPGQFGPCAPPERCRLIWHAIDCRPCPQDRCPQPRCMDMITADEVFDGCRGQLRMRPQARQPITMGGVS